MIIILDRVKRNVTYLQNIYFKNRTFWIAWQSTFPTLKKNYSEIDYSSGAQEFSIRSGSCVFFSDSAYLNKNLPMHFWISASNSYWYYISTGTIGSCLRPSTSYRHKWRSATVFLILLVKIPLFLTGSLKKKKSH